jgi:hypothetical protein
MARVYGKEGGWLKRYRHRFILDVPATKRVRFDLFNFCVTR